MNDKASSGIRPNIPPKTDSDNDSDNERVGFGYFNKKSKNGTERENSKAKISFQKASITQPVAKSSTLSFEQQMKDAADRAKKIAEKLNSKSVSSLNIELRNTCSSNSVDSMTPDQQKQYLEQKEVINLSHFNQIKKYIFKIF